jgi:hypothetical protein
MKSQDSSETRFKIDPPIAMPVLVQRASEMDGR